MQLGTFTPNARSVGDQWPAKEAVDRPLVVLVREHRSGIVTKYKPEGAAGVVVDVVDLSTGAVYIDVLWMNGAVVDALAAYVGQALPIRLVWTPSARGGNPYIAVAALDGSDLALAQQWASANPDRVDRERAARKNGGATTPAAVTTPAPAAPVAPAADPAVQALLAQIAAGGAPTA
ncbi:hypothetical protein LX15_004780 [Streptoalloteichus tenebrarius]|uniref:Uncharacterized protein n=1 Tax=Streptoalloteichus tenebrarius (strain ATCC 17920 / DSM 40477 / JCM 4838 / CBS 697.72 / NBRC 16177 / NCIMB 11028 / NRRL B-12390 / A12253. 1 / ISP 5477) TaxID=1933 RepID=A0ABT1HZZ2_STRSD|nr:hypothetical protein [Streptoalloteichus tenebrarius]MCP2261060.1 hypothetical protein [Streptoalloteichus tenebrarius]BFF03145.1 hypothetical protein GCM10020241_48200 [Streptoalloteichus tenebrarius]